MSDATKVYIIHDNLAWLTSLQEALNDLKVPFVLWDVGAGGVVDLNEEPPLGIFFNRVSPSSHTRGNRWAIEHTQQILDWLDTYGRRIINGVTALAMEVSKVRQYQLLVKEGIPTPKTIALTGDPKEEWFAKKALEMVEKHFPDEPFIIKQNRGGSGAGVALMRSPDELIKYVSSTDYEQPLDGVLLLQTYIPCADKKIIRCEFVNKKFIYAVHVDTSRGFQLCPADVCSAKEGENCPISRGAKNKFVVDPDFSHEIISKLENVLEETNIEVAGIEIIQGDDGVTYCYDMNANTNYNRAAEERCFGQMKGNVELARFFRALLIENSA